MEKETKFDIGDKVWYIKNNKVCKSTIVKIKYIKVLDLENEFYSLRDEKDKNYEYSKLFLSKEDLINSL